MEIYRILTLVSIFLIGIGSAVAAWLAWRIFFYYGVHSAAKWLVSGFIIKAVSWILINGGAQIFIPIGTEHRQEIIIVSLLGMVIGVTCIAWGLFSIYWHNIRGK